MRILTLIWYYVDIDNILYTILLLHINRLTHDFRRQCKAVKPDSHAPDQGTLLLAAARQAVLESMAQNLEVTEKAAL